MPQKQVRLCITGKSQDAEEKPEEIRLWTTGTLTGTPDAWRIDYTETQPDNESNDVTLLLDHGTVTMQRAGDFSTSMVFEQGRRFEGSYQTPFGALGMGVYATQVQYQVDEQLNGQVNLKYQLDLQGQYAAMHELHISFSEARA